MSIPAIPPNDYKGTQADWIAALISRGYIYDHDGYRIDCEGWIGDIELMDSVYWEILEECEKGRS